MCGIVGYVGQRQTAKILVDALKRLEYRGYDSCGIAIQRDGTADLVRSVGRISGLEQKIGHLVYPPNGVTCGIGHTRWATHGRPREENAHPHRDCRGHFFVVHNGIVENYLELRRRLIARGHRFKTETDTEVLPHLIEFYFQGNLEQAVRAALAEVEGAYSVVVISPLDGLKLVAARKGAPLVVGVGQGENFVASDTTALLPFTQHFLFLEDRELVVARPDSVTVQNFDGQQLSRPAQRLSWDAQMVEKEGYPHFMLKEIHEQPRAVRNTLAGRVSKDDALLLEEEVPAMLKLGALRDLTIVACGTSLHAGLLGKFIIEKLARLPVQVDCASEFRYRDALVGGRSLVIGISQSGETADTLGALREAGQKGAFLLSICNVLGSSLTRDSDAVLYTRAGPEIGVASTKTFTAQVVALYLLALFLAQRRRTLSQPRIRQHIRWLKQIPEKMQRVLMIEREIAALAQRFASSRNFLFLGRGMSYPVAVEGALKLKEISYVHAEGYTAGEMKHGPIALIDGQMPVVVLAPRDSLYRKTMGNIEEVKVREGIVLAVASEGDIEIQQKADHALYIPLVEPLLHPLLSVVPLQLFAYHMGVLRGCDVDKPRNLAKSVTVE